MLFQKKNKKEEGNEPYFLRKIGENVWWIKAVPLYSTELVSIA